MAAILEQLRLWIVGIISTLGYPGISLAMLLENLFPLIPSEIVMSFTGFLVSEGSMGFWPALLFGTLGSLLGALAIYWIGKAAGEERLQGWFKRNGKYLLLEKQDFNRAMDAFERHGSTYVLVGRLIPGVRSLISLPAGIKNMNLALFLLFSLLGTAAWNVLLLLAGVFLGRQWRQVLEWVQTYELVVWVALGLLIAFLLARRFFNQDRDEPGPSQPEQEEG